MNLAELFIYAPELERPMFEAARAAILRADCREAARLLHLAAGDRKLPYQRSAHTIARALDKKAERQPVYAK